MTLDEVVRDVAHWADRVPASAAPKRADELLARYRSGGHSPSADLTARDFARVAVHEAAHAAVAHSAGLSPTHAKVNRDGSGECGYTRDYSAIDRGMWTVTTDLAGVCAELFADAPSAGRRWSLANGFDIHQAASGIAAFRAAAPKWNVPTRTFVIIALAAVHTNWPAIQRIARVLRERSEITAEEIDELCGELQ
jgi:hypothetical protein